MMLNPTSSWSYCGDRARARFAAANLMYSGGNSDL